MTEQTQPTVPWLLGWAQILWIQQMISEGRTPEEALDHATSFLTPRARQEIQRHRERVLDFFRMPRIEGHDQP